MSLAVAIQMDPLETVNIDADSTFVLALEAQRRGHGLYHYLPKHLSYRKGLVVA
jgi:glutathione synthase